MDEKNVEFGSKQWFAKLNEISNFPAVFTFVIDTSKNIFSLATDFKGESVDNVRYKTIKTYDPRLAILKVVRCHSDEQYFEEVKTLKDIWKSEEAKQAEVTK